MRQEHLVESVLYAFCVVYQVLVDRLLFVFFAIQYRGQFRTCILLSLPCQGRFKDIILGVSCLLDDFLKSNRQFGLRVHIVLYDHFGHFYMVGDSKEFEDHIEGDINIEDALVLLESGRYFARLVLVGNCHLVRMLESIAVFA